MNLVVVTHTRPESTRDMSACVDSVGKAMEGMADVSHVILTTKRENLERARYDAMGLGDAVVFVDDDDYIYPASLRVCMYALRKTGSGLVFADEVIMESDMSKSLASNSGDVTYGMMCVLPQIVHGMCVMRTSAVTEKSLALSEEFGCGIEWIMRVEAASILGAVHVPMNGYYWVQHEGQDHRTYECEQSFRKNIRPIGTRLRSWMTHSGTIPTMRLS